MSLRSRPAILSRSQPAPLAAREWLSAFFILGLAALAVVAPLIVQGPSCGHDFTFHLQSWLDAAAQLRHGTLLPRWAFSPAWNAGEPRFMFYPPISWLLGAALEFVLPAGAVPIVFTWIALTAAGFGLYRLARDFAPSTPSLLAATLYQAGPYAIFTAFERTAYAELLAAAWLPLLLRAALRPQLSVPEIAVPLALLWLTNAPAAVMGAYAFAVLILFRAASEFLHNRNSFVRSAWPLLLRSSLGVVLGFALAGFYLVPAALERRWVEISMALIPNMRIEDNFLFGHTGNGPHDAVLHTASLLAVSLLAVTVLTLIVAILRDRLTSHPAQHPDLSSRPEREARSGETAVFPGSRANLQFSSRRRQTARNALPSLALLTLLIAFLLTSPSKFFWEHLPELSFLQFPWRLLAVLSVVLACVLSLLLARVDLRPAAAASLCVALALTGGLAANYNFRQTCERDDLPTRRIALFTTGHGFAPTDEYTPADADNDLLRSDDPPFWLAAEPGRTHPAPHPTRPPPLRTTTRRRRTRRPFPAALRFTSTCTSKRRRCWSSTCVRTRPGMFLATAFRCRF